VTDEEERDRLRRELTKRVGDGASSLAMANLIHSSADLELLRCFDKFFTVPDKELMNSIDGAYGVISGRMRRTDASTFLTADMLKSWERVIDKFRELDAPYKDAHRQRFCAFTFARMDRAETILFLLEEHGITDMYQIDRYLDDFDVTSTAPPLRDGAL
jgi:hypothetical protein